MHQYARIAGIADIFDAVTAERPHRLAQSSFAVLEIVCDEMTDGLERDLFREPGLTPEIRPGIRGSPQHFARFQIMFS